MAETLEDIIRDRLLAKHPSGGGSGDGAFFNRRQSKAKLVIRVLVRQHDGGGGGGGDASYGNETYDVVVLAKDVAGQESPRNFEVTITAETYRQRAFLLTSLIFVKFWHRVTGESFPEFCL